MGYPRTKILLWLLLLLPANTGWSIDGNYSAGCQKLCNLTGTCDAYPEALRDIGTHTDHTIGDVVAYARSKLGSDLIDAARSGEDIDVVIIKGLPSNVLAFVQNEGITQVKRISNPTGFNSVYEYVKDGKKGFLVTRVNGNGR